MFARARALVMPLVGASLVVALLAGGARADSRRKPLPTRPLDDMEGPKPKPDDKPAPPPPPAPPKKAAAEPEKTYDPANVTAISQSLDTLVRGNARYAEKDYMGAIDLYRRGIALNPKNPLGPYLLGEAQLATGNLAEAEAAFKQAEELTDSRNQVLRSRVLFAVADVYEREKKWIEAEAAWRGYREHMGKVPDGGAYPTTSQARIDAIVKMRELTASYESVRARIKTEKASPPSPPAKK